MELEGVLELLTGSVCKIVIYTIYNYFRSKNVLTLFLVAERCHHIRIICHISFTFCTYCR